MITINLLNPAQKWPFQPCLATVAKYHKLSSLIEFNIIIADIKTVSLHHHPADFAVNYLKAAAISLKPKQQDVQVFYYFGGLYLGDNVISMVRKFHPRQKKNEKTVCGSFSLGNPCGSLSLTGRVMSL